jgi:hypothetical protein
MSLHGLFVRAWCNDGEGSCSRSGDVVDGRRDRGSYGLCAVPFATRVRVYGLSEKKSIFVGLETNNDICADNIVSVREIEEKQ